MAQNDLKNDNVMNNDRLIDGFYDRLTGLPTMNHFFEIAYHRRAEIIKEGNHPSIVFFDFNGMKNFNNKFGFAEGDKLIIAMSKVLKENFGAESCSRIGGDRFAVAAFEEGLEDRLKTVFEECRSMNEGRSLPIRAGIYPLRMGDVGIALACDRAKMACDINRDSYVSRYAFFSEDMLKAAEKRRYIIENFDKALNEGWIQVYYQPIIRSTNGRVSDEEALARWIDPEKGFMSPADFIPVLEDSHLIYKLDLYVARKIVEKQKVQEEAGIYIVPCSVNISRSDFEACDIVEEIRKIVDEVGSKRSLLTVEITESMLAADFEYMKKQAERFQALGFKVWMDDYGSGYSSPIILQKMRFDTIKLDMEFLSQFDKNDDSKIILSSLIKMAMGLGIDTVVEGVETEEQAKFLKEVGCTKLQGYYYNKPIPLEKVMERYRTGVQIGFENPDETGYYAEIGKYNLYELSFTADGNGKIGDYFNTMPMAIMELKDDAISMIRCNRNFKEYLNTNIVSEQYKGLPGGCDAAFKGVLNHCVTYGHQNVVDMNTANGKKVHMLLRPISVNPVNGAQAVVLVILGVSEDTVNEDNLSFAAMAQVLSADYIFLYHVDIEKDTFVEYTPDAVRGDVSVERRGDDFFNACRRDSVIFVHEDDRERFLEKFTKDNILNTIKEHGTFTLTYRLMFYGKPLYVDLKAIRIGNGSDNILIGINNIDTQMRQLKELERFNEERIVYSRITALAGNYIAFYTIDPKDWSYTIYRANSDFDKLETSRTGNDFFKDAHRESKRIIYKDDQELFAKGFNKTKILKQIEKTGLFTLTYRLKVGDSVKYVCLKAAMVSENGRKQLILGINDIDERVKRDQEQALSLSAARSRVNLDELTGVKNKHAYIDVENEINKMIADGNVTPFALVMLDLVGLRNVNDSLGHRAGDEFLKLGCKVICDVFQHSPVYRVGGDEFVVIVTGRDYDQIDVLMDLLMKKNRASMTRGGVIVAGGMARYSEDESVEKLFRRADRAMYENKKELNKMKLD